MHGLHRTIQRSRPTTQGHLVTTCAADLNGPWAVRHRAASDMILVPWDAGIVGVPVMRHQLDRVLGTTNRDAHVVRKRRGEGPPPDLVSSAQQAHRLRMLASDIATLRWIGSHIEQL